MPNSNRKLQNFKKYFNKTFHKFTNYTKNQKLFTIFLLIFAIALIVCPIAKVTYLESTKPEYFWFIGKTYFKSMIIVLISMLFLLWWNMNTRFKGFVVNFLWFRESEPMLNFIFLWVIASNFLWIMDAIGMVVPALTERASIVWWGRVILLLLLVWIIISLIEVWKWADKNSQRTKVVTIVDDDEEAPQKPEWNKRILKHLFDDEELEW